MADSTLIAPTANPLKTRGLWLGLLLHGIAPAAAVISMGAPPLWLVSTVLFVFGMVAWAPAGRSWPVSIIGCVVSGLWMLLSLMLAAAYFSQGQGFDDAFFFHFNLPAITAGFGIYPLQSYGSMAFLVLAALWPLMLKSARARVGLAVLAVAVLVSTPVHSLINYRSGLDAIDSEAVAPLQQRVASQVNLAPPGTNKNIVLIYVEGLEQAYFDREVFGDLLPRLSALNAQGARFTDLEQVRGTGWTIAGMIASQCGFPLITSDSWANNSTIASAERPFEDSVCLGDILQDKGYLNIFYGGADHRFAGKGNFLRTHGFKEVYGLEELAPGLDDGMELSKWGLYDKQIFDIALERIAALEAASSSPWMVSVLTVDTHFPRGHPSPGCAPYEGSDDEISQAIYCTDQVLSEFVAQVQAVTDPENTLIALFSDHLSFRNTLEEKVFALEERRLWFTLLDANLGAGEFDISGSHFDITPTLLNVAGIETSEAPPTGISLVSDDSKNRMEYAEVVAAAPEILATSPSALDTGALINASDWSISFGDFTLVPHVGGYPFSEGIFMALLDENGRVTDTVYEYDSDFLLERHAGRFVVGISVINDATLAVAFVGTISEDPNLMNQALLQQNLFISPAQFAQWIAVTKPPN